MNTVDAPNPQSGTLESLQTPTSSLSKRPSTISFIGVQK